VIIGIGLDLCSVTRIRSLLKDERFLLRYFSQDEQGYIQSRGAMAAASAAACFAAKEALAKALGTGFEGMPPKDICILHDENGAPSYKLEGLALSRALAKGMRSAYLSLSHEQDMAAAVAVLEGE
jgi:holo-[acyl-carrier protein] synthase